MPTKSNSTLVINPESGYVNRLLVGTPSRGPVRMEWVQARYGQVIPTNWSMVQMIQYVSSYVPMRYSVADAQNLIVNEAVTKGYEWLILIEDDTMPPADAFIRFNEYMRKGDIPVVSGLYFTRSEPPEPMVYRGRGNSFYTDWKMGEKVWVDGVPTGMLLIHCNLLKEIWKDSPEYNAGGQVIRRVFETPVRTWFDETTGALNTWVGTSDLDWCTRVREGDYLKKAGFKSVENKRYPFLIDTNIFCRHIDPDGTQFPIEMPSQYKAE